MISEKTIDREKLSKITKQVGFNYITIIAQILLAPVLIAILTRTLTVYEYGVYSLLTAFVLLLMSFFELGVSQYIITKLSGAEIKERVKNFYSILKFEAIFVSAALLIFLISPLSSWFLKINNLSAYGFELKIGCVIIFFGILSRVYEAYFKAIKKINTANFFSMILNKGWVVILLLVFLSLRKFTLANSLEAWLIGALIVIISYTFLARNEIGEYLKLNAGFYKLKKTIYFSMPLILVIISSWFLAASNRYILNYYTTLPIVGIYTLGYSFMGVVTTFGTTVSQVIQPYFTESYAKKDHYNILISASLKYGLLLILPSIIGITVLRTELITMVSGAKYLASAPVIPILALYPLFALVAFVFYQVLIAADRTFYVGIMHLIALIVSVASNISLIPAYGMGGAAAASVLSYGFIATAMYFPAKKYVQIKTGFLKITRILCAAFIMGASLYIIKGVVPLNIITKILLVAFGGGIYFILVFILKIFDKSEISVVKKFMPQFVYRALGYKQEGK